MNNALEQQIARRQFLTQSAGGLGAIALSQLAGKSNAAEIPSHFPARAKRVIYLFMSGGPSQMETFDPKPKLRELHGQPLPESIRKGQRLTSMTSGYDPRIAQSEHKFARVGQCGHEMNVLFKNLGKVADDLSVVRSMHTDPINHDPAVTFIQTGSGVEGRPSLGSWLSYGLGSENSELPGFVVLVSSGGQPLLSRYWHNGFLPSRHQGVQFQTQGDPVLFLSDPDGVPRDLRRASIDAIPSTPATVMGHVVRRGASPSVGTLPGTTVAGAEGPVFQPWTDVTGHMGRFGTGQTMN